MKTVKIVQTSQGTYAACEMLDEYSISSIELIDDLNVYIKTNNHYNIIISTIKGVNFSWHNLKLLWTILMQIQNLK